MPNLEDSLYGLTIMSIDKVEKSVENVRGWEEARDYAVERIKDLRFSVRLFEKMISDGVPESNSSLDWIQTFFDVNPRTYFFKCGFAARTLEIRQLGNAEKWDAGGCGIAQPVQSPEIHRVLAVALIDLVHNIAHGLAFFIVEES
jgi:hypothetical protein